MKKLRFTIAAITFAVLFANDLMAQTSNYVYTVAGGGSSLGDGGPATNAQVSATEGVWGDAMGNIYISDMGNNRIRKVSVSGIITTIAGGGTSSADGIPAVNAQIRPYGIGADAAGNVFIADMLNRKIRKVDAASGVITTIAGGGSSIGDNVPATSVSISTPYNVYVHATGDVYFTAGGELRKVSATTGIISKIAGGGSSLGDGGPATNAQLSSMACGICFDIAGNIYIADRGNDRIRKIDAATGIINTVAGGGASTAEGIIATSASLNNPIGLAVDCMNNLIIADNHRDKIKYVDATTGLIKTIAGGGTSSTEGDLALNTNLHPEFLYLDAHGNLFYSNFGNQIRRITNLNPGVGGASGVTADSFTSYPITFCNGPEITVSTNTYTAGKSIITSFGDGTFDTSVITPSFWGTSGYAIIKHSYSNSGTYTIKQVLYSGTTIIDSLNFSISYTFCRTLPVGIFYDANSNCMFDNTESSFTLPTTTEVDSNGVTIARVSATSGFYYNAYGVPGDIYKFKIVKAPTGISVVCPTSGSIIDTLLPSANYPTKNFGLNCATSSVYDLSVHGTIPVTGTHDQWGDVYVQNTSCFPVTGILTVTFSPKYEFRGNAHPAPSSHSGNTLTWNLGAMSSSVAGSSPIHIHYQVDNPTSGPLTIRDTVHTRFSVTPVVGDDKPTNNAIVIIDTVRAGCDPNYIEVSPGRCLPKDIKKLRYTIHFENTGNDTAHNIYVMDTLSAFLNPDSVNILMASAPMNIQLLKINSYNIIKFDFPNIKLLDSSHHGECDGAVVFEIDLNPGLSAGVSILNHAGIFFDKNPVVMTNTVENIFDCPVLNISDIPITKGEISLYPNPATDELTIKTANSNYTSLSISNSVGQVMMQQAISNTQTKVNVKALPAGLYYVTVKGENGNSVQKFVKL